MEDILDSKDTPLRAYIKDGVLHIEVGVDTLAHAVIRSEWAWRILGNNEDGILPEDRFSITDTEEFAKEILEVIEREDETGSSRLTYLLDEAAETAMSEGSEYFRDKNDDDYDR